MAQPSVYTQAVNDSLAQPRRYNQSMSATPEYPMLKAVGDSPIKYVAPGIADSLTKLGSGRGLGVGDYASSVLDAAPMPAGRAAAPFVRQGFQATRRNLMEQPFDAARRAGLKAAGRRAVGGAKAAVGAGAAVAANAMMHKVKPTAWGSLAPAAREEVQMLAKLGKASLLDRKINYKLYGKYLDPLFKPPVAPAVTRREAFKPLGALTLMPGLSPLSKASRAMENAALTYKAPRNWTPARDAAAAAAVARFSDALTAPVTRRNLLKGAGTYGAAKFAGAL
jgi:hypothetical protein